LGHQHDGLHIREVVKLARAALVVEQPKVVDRLAGAQREGEFRCAERGGGDDEFRTRIHTVAVLLLRMRAVCDGGRVQSIAEPLF
jgi:hypothetical protein